MRLARRLFLPVSLVLIVWASFAVPLPLLMELPDEPVSLDAVVTVEVEGAALNGDYLLSTVRLRRGTVAGLVEAVVFEGVGLQPVERIIPPGEDDRAYFERQRGVFALAGQVAAAVGLRAAGYDADPEHVVGSGVLVVDVLPGTPADGVLRPGDVIVEVDGTAVRDVDDIRPHLGGGEDRARNLRFLREEEAMEAAISPAELPTADGPVRGIGVRIQTHEPRVALPAEVRIDGGRVGGPSAGLMIALTVYDKATPDHDLAAGRRIGGTGVLSGTGAVSVVGGMPQKVLAAHRLGAEVFLVPRAQHHRALGVLPEGSSMTILPVSTFDEAVEALQARPAAAAASLGNPPWSAPGGWTARSRATPHREPGQGRKAAAISGSRRVPRSRRAVARPAVTTARPSVAQIS